jgi:hypothetical protein
MAGGKRGSKVATSQNATAEWILADDVIARGILNGTTLRIVEVAIDELGENIATDNTLRTVVRKESESGDTRYNQYILALKNGDTPVIISVGAIARQLDNREAVMPNEITARLAEGAINALSGKLLKVRKTSGMYTYKEGTPAVRSYSLGFELVEGAEVTPLQITDAEKVGEFIERIQSAREFAERNR